MRHVSTLPYLILLMIAGGCGGGAGKAVDVAGTISLDGKPLPGVEVYFATDKFEGYGKTDDDGKYRLVNGALAGANKVYLKKFDTDSPANTGVKIDQSIAGMDDKQMAAMLQAQGKGKGGKKSGSLVPAEYSDPKTTKLSFTVPDGGTESADFRISSSK